MMVLLIHHSKIQLMQQHKVHNLCRAYYQYENIITSNFNSCKDKIIMWYLQTTAFLLGNTSNMYNFEWVRFVLSLVTIKNWPVGSLFCSKNPLNSRYFCNIVDNFWSSEDNFLLDLDKDMESYTIMHCSFNAKTVKT